MWENGGPAIDLNTLVPAGSDLTVTEPIYINDRGEIAGSALDADGNVHAFLLIPCSTNDADGCQDAAAGTAATRDSPARAMQRPAGANQNNSVRQMLQRRPGFRYHILGLQSPSR